MDICNHADFGVFIMKKTPNSVKLQKLLDSWPDLRDYPLRVKEADRVARTMFDALIKAVKQDEQIARELEEKNQLKMF